MMYTSAAIIPEKAIKILWHIKDSFFIKICNGGIKGAKPLYVYPLCTDSSVPISFSTAVDILFGIIKRCER